MKRIRYDENGISKYCVTSSRTNAVYEIIIDKNNCTYKIKNVNSGRVYLSKTDWTNVKVMQRNLRWHLESLGVEFEKEVQIRKEK